MTARFLASFDIEDWFHADSVKESLPTSDWTALEGRVERNTHELLDILGEAEVKSTFFVLGWIARRYPGLVERIVEEGHELASHSYAHHRLYSLSRDEVTRDLAEARETLEQLAGVRVWGIRAPTFSISEDVFDCLAEAGYWYDSSFYAFRHRYGRPTAGIDPETPVAEVRPGLLELPMSRVKLGPVALPWSGGGYFRLIPYRLFRLGVARTLRTRSWFMFYLHPWELDFEQTPPAQMSATTRFTAYVGRNRMRSDLGRLLWEFGSERIDRALTSMGYRPPPS